MEIALGISGGRIDMNARLTADILDKFLRDRYRNREHGDPDSVDELARELVSHNYDTVVALAAMLGRNTEALRTHEETNPPNGEPGARFNSVGAVRISLAAEIPDYYSRAQASRESASEPMARGSEAGDPDDAYQLGRLFEGRGELDEAEAAYRLADEHGHGAGAWRLGVLLAKRGEVEQAQAAYRRADERGSAGGALNVGVFLEKNGDSQGALAAYARSEERGNVDAAAAIGTLLENLGDLAGAESAYERGDANGSSFAVYDLGVILLGRGDLEAARAAFRRASERGYPVPPSLL